MERQLKNRTVFRIYYHTMYNVYQLPFSSVDVRLVDGSTEYEGRVEVYRDGSWGTVCGSNFDENDANFVCRALGHW